MAFEHPLIPGAFDRSVDKPDMADVVFVEGRILQGAELNEAQSILRGRIARAGGLSARDGDRISGAAIIVDSDAGTVTLEAGTIYASGDVRRARRQPHRPPARRYQIPGGFPRCLVGVAGR